MAKGVNQKQKMLYLAKIFLEETDEEHGLTLAEISEKLGAYGVTGDRKTLYQDFEELRRFGLDILASKEGTATSYRLVSRTFELPELKLLVDSVQSSKFITEKKSEALIHKLESLVSVYEAGQLQRQVLTAGRVKSMNESIYYSVDTLHAAIHQGRQIRFQYVQWNVKKEPEFRHDGALYDIGPWYLWWDQEYYYLIGYDGQAGGIRHYRVDKMRNIEITDRPRRGSRAMKNFDPAAYTRSLFGMYSGTILHVTLEGANEMVGVLLDRFGMDIPITPLNAYRFRAVVEVAVSPQFYGWVASLGGDIVVRGPSPVVREMQEFSKRLARQYAEG